jgi:hypothetical protein
MNATEFAAALRYLVPRFQVVEGCYSLILSGIPESSALSVREGIKYCKGDLKLAEHQMNRCFIVEDVLNALHLAGVDDCEPSDLALVAEILASLIRDGLRQVFPEQRFEVEVIGSNYADEDPLEVCVTFSRADT